MPASTARTATPSPRLTPGGGAELPGFTSPSPTSERASPQTLREFYGEMADSEAIIRAFEEQVSGTGNKRRGFGLSQIRGCGRHGPRQRSAHRVAVGACRAIGTPLQKHRARELALPGNARIRLRAVRASYNRTRDNGGFPMASIVLSSYGRMFATRGQVGELLGGEADTADAASIMIDASDVYMSPSFIAELLVTLVEEHKYERVLVRGARERPAKGRAASGHEVRNTGTASRWSSPPFPPDNRLRHLAPTRVLRSRRGHRRAYARSRRQPSRSPTTERGVGRVGVALGDSQPCAR